MQQSALPEKEKKEVKTGEKEGGRRKEEVQQRKERLARRVGWKISNRSVVVAVLMPIYFCENSRDRLDKTYLCADFMRFCDSLSLVAFKFGATFFGCQVFRFLNKRLQKPVACGRSIKNRLKRRKNEQLAKNRWLVDWPPVSGFFRSTA